MNKTIPATLEETIIWDRYKKKPKDPSLVLSYTFKIIGKLDIEKLKSSIEKTLRYSAEKLLYTFFEKNNVLYKQKVEAFKPYLHILNQNSLVNTETFTYQISIDEGKLFYFAIKSFNEHRHTLYLTFSHIAFDGLSYAPFIKQLATFYNNVNDIDNYLQNTNINTYENTIQKEDVLFWKKKLKEVPLGQNLSFQIQSKDVNSSNCFFINKFEICDKELLSFNKFCKDNKATPFQTILLIYGILLINYHNCEENDRITISYSVSKRNNKNDVGCYLNVLPFFFPKNSAWSIKDYLEYIKAERKEAKKYQKFPLKELIKLSDQNVNSLTLPFNLILNESEGLLPQEELNLKDCSIKLEKGPNLTGPYDLGLNYSISSERLIIAISAPSNKMTENGLNEFARLFKSSFNFCLSNIDKKISDFNLSEKLYPIMEGDNFHIDKNDLIINHFLKNMSINSEKPAIISNNGIFSYEKINSIRLNICQAIIEKFGNLKDCPGIGIYIERTELLPSVILALLTLEIPFVPLDGSLPKERLLYIIKTSKIEIVLVDDNFNHSIFENTIYSDEYKISLLKISTSTHFTKTTQVTALPKIHHDFNAYILFTSGSTGNPKGVMVSHYNLLNFLYSMKHLLDIAEEDCTMALTPISFDISILELLLPLFTGGTIEMIDNTTRLDALALSNKIHKSKTTIVQATPATFKMLRSVNWKSSRELLILCGGEALDESIANYLLDQNHIVYNMYGPTEATIWSSLHRITSNRPISIGFPVFNTKYFVVDEKFNSVPLGVSGQLLIAGSSVSKGYIQDLSKNSFINLPGVTDSIYCTGDWVEFLGKDILVYKGRKDSTYKINGHRIDLSEIESAVSRIYQNINFFVTVRFEKNENQYIACFYHNTTDNLFDKTKCLVNLKSILPSYMIPRVFYKLRTIPLNSSGKVNMDYLSKMNIDQIDIDKFSPNLVAKNESIKITEHENLYIKNLYQIFKDVFNIEIDDFDSPLGTNGFNSILYTQLSAVLKTEFSIEIAPHEFYQFSTLSDISTVISKKISKNSLLESPYNKKENKSTIIDKEPSEIGILGISVLMPQNLEIEDYWQALLTKSNLISSPSKGRDLPEEMKAGYLSDIDSFDSSFFAISPLESSRMDPRQKILLQVAWKTIEDAGFSKQQLNQKKVGCYIAIAGNDYANINALKKNNLTPYSLTGTSISILSNRISSYFDWRGPSITIDTACSGSLIALVQACNDLMSGVCDFAFVGSANLILDKEVTLALKAGNFLSSNFRCATFDAAADGYARAEGFCGVFLTRLDLNNSKNYAIHGLIKSWAIGHGGKANSLTAPNINALTDLLLDAYTPELAKQVSYIETHGTGTKLGDPIEITSLKRAWEKLLGNNFNKIYLGAVKSNIGHLESSAGGASLAKVLMAFKYKILPTNLHFKKLNEEIDLTNSPFEILKDNIKWDHVSNRVAGISSFGFGGSNAHIVVSEPDHRISNQNNKTQSIQDNYHIVVISARTERSFKKYLKKLHDFLINIKISKKQYNLKDIAYTLATGRTHFEYRAAWIVNSLENLIQLTEQPSDFSLVKKSKFIKNFGQHKTKYVNLDEIRLSFLKGEFINWNELYKSQNVKKAHLPTYVFDSLF